MAKKIYEAINEKDVFKKHTLTSQNKASKVQKDAHERVNGFSGFSHFNITFSYSQFSV